MDQKNIQVEENTLFLDFIRDLIEVSDIKNAPQSIHKVLQGLEAQNDFGGIAFALIEFTLNGKTIFNNEADYDKRPGHIIYHSLQRFAEKCNFSCQQQQPQQDLNQEIPMEQEVENLHKELDVVYCSQAQARILMKNVDAFPLVRNSDGVLILDDSKIVPGTRFLHDGTVRRVLQPTIEFESVGDTLETTCKRFYYNWTELTQSGRRAFLPSPVNLNDYLRPLPIKPVQYQISPIKPQLLKYPHLKQDSMNEQIELNHATPKPLLIFPKHENDLVTLGKRLQELVLTSDPVEGEIQIESEEHEDLLFSENIKVALDYLVILPSESKVLPSDPVVTLINREIVLRWNKNVLPHQHQIDLAIHNSDTTYSRLRGTMIHKVFEKIALNYRSGINEFNETDFNCRLFLILLAQFFKRLLPGPQDFPLKEKHLFSFYSYLFYYASFIGECEYRLTSFDYEKNRMSENNSRIDALVVGPKKEKNRDGFILDNKTGFSGCFSGFQVAKYAHWALKLFDSSDAYVKKFGVKHILFIDFLYPDLQELRRVSLRKDAVVTNNEMKFMYTTQKITNSGLAPPYETGECGVYAKTDQFGNKKWFPIHNIHEDSQYD